MGCRPHLLILVASFVMGCGGAAPKSTQTPSSDGASPKALPSSPQAAPPAAQATSEPPLASESDRADPTTADEALGALDADEVLLTQLLSQQAIELSHRGDGCGRICVALESMRRSVVAVCELTGDHDGRCQSARTRLEDVTGRVSDAGCRCGP